jgi:hypothetical protein
MRIGTPKRLKRKRNAARIINNVKSTFEIEAVPLDTPEKPRKPATTAAASVKIAHCIRFILFLLPFTRLIVLLIFPFDSCPRDTMSRFLACTVSKSFFGLIVLIPCAIKGLQVNLLGMLG